MSQAFAEQDSPGLCIYSATACAPGCAKYNACAAIFVECHIPYASALIDCSVTNAKQRVSDAIQDH
jgi:hypothetical protein